MKELTFKEVIANIKEGQVWGAYDKKIIRTSTGIIFENFGSYFEIGDHFTFKLQRKEYTFEEAFKALEEGKIIESCYSQNKFRGNQVLRKNEFNWRYFESFKLGEIRSEWYINEVD